MSSSTSSDSDSEERAKFKDAAIDVGNIFHVPAPGVKSFQAKKCTPPFRRDQSSYRNLLGVDTTAEFRSFVATKLYESLERRIKFKKVVKETSSEGKEEYKDVPSDWGFRLLSSSVSNSRTEVIPETVKRSRAKSISSSSDSDSHKTLASVAVDLQTILDDRTMLNKFRAKEKTESSEMEEIPEQTKQHVQNDGDTYSQPNAKRKAKRKKVKVDRETAT